MFFLWDFKTHITYETNSDSARITLIVWEKEFSIKLVVPFFFIMYGGVVCYSKISPRKPITFFKYSKISNDWIPLTLLRMWGPKKAHPTSSSTVTSTNVAISPQNILIFSITFLLQWCNVSRPYLVPLPHYQIIVLEPRSLLKKVVFQISFIPGRHWVAIFADIIKIVMIFIKKILKTQKKFKKIEILYQNTVYICITWYRKISWFSV